MCAMISVALVSSFLGLASIHNPPLGHMRTQILDSFFFLYKCGFLCTLSCPATCIRGTRCSTFSPLQTRSCDTVVSVAERSQTYSQSTVLTHTLQQKIAMAVTYVFKTSGLKAKKKKKNSTLFLAVFSDRRHDQARLRSELCVSCMATCVSIRP